MVRDNDRRIWLLRQILEKKDILFGRFSQNLSNEDKENAWKDIFNLCKSHGFDFVSRNGTEHDWKYLRDTIWGSNLKAATLKKMKPPTGTEGGEQAVLTEIDDLVLAILGKDSPTVVGINSKDGETDSSSLVCTSSAAIDETVSSGLECESLEEEIPRLRSHSKPASESVLQKRKPEKSQNIVEGDSEILKMKKMKLELQLEGQVLANYEAKLRIIKLEKELNIPTKFGLNNIKFQL